MLCVVYLINVFPNIPNKIVKNAIINPIIFFVLFGGNFWSCIIFKTKKSRLKLINKLKIKFKPRASLTFSK